MALKRTFSAADGGAGRRRRRARLSQSQSSMDPSEEPEDDPFGFFDGGGGGGGDGSTRSSPGGQSSQGSPGLGVGSPRDEDSSPGSQGLSSMSYHKMSTDTRRRKGASLHTMSSGRIRAQMDELVFHLDGLCSGELGAQRQRCGTGCALGFGCARARALALLPLLRAHPELCGTKLPRCWH
jgi:hypothetical protein